MNSLILISPPDQGEAFNQFFLVNFYTVIASSSAAIAESRDCCEFLGITVTVNS
ncbi:MAG: hypothetical protein JGK10_05055 [Microcoleus sp. PH2017_13_LAR_U_A]|uniref:hypothetical protein n=1 Tax=Microcoleus sp. PH2017_13_LAR_U_A TaxID=2798824 RepID=UPI001D3DEE90|nr:hypothetical protein [Microcoleus sp. PH2017_13_LAR_U_A]MCC3471191.1 hypothetical protein [Microcoleus sp. PH2017_13_LAR_U_A]